MVTGLITGPNRIPDLNVVEAMGREGVYAFHFPEEARSRILELQQATPPVIYYPPDLPTDRREGRLFAVAEVVRDPEVEEPEAPPDIIVGVQLTLVPEPQPLEQPVELLLAA